jgi:hypothetical protein
MILIFYGLPGSGKKTLAEKLCKDFNLKFYPDFYNDKFDLDNKDDSIYTMFFPQLDKIIKSSSLDSKILTLFFPQVFTPTEDPKYSEHFGLDIRYLYEQNPFKNISGNNNENEDLFIGNFGIMFYNYNYDTFKEKLSNFKEYTGNTELEVLEYMKKRNLKLDYVTIENILKSRFSS